MSQSNPVQTVAPVTAGKIYLALVGVGCMCALIIVSVFLGTYRVIESNRVEALEKAIFDVLPGARNTQTFALNELNQFVPFDSQSALLGAKRVFAGFDQAQNLVGVAIMASGQGYQDVIKVIYGYQLNEQVIIGLKVLESRETPGLGDKIEKDPVFIQNFTQLDVTVADDGETVLHPIVAVKSGQKSQAWEVDGITGATVSSQAIADILRTSTDEWVPLIKQSHQVFTYDQGGSNGN